MQETQEEVVRCRPGNAEDPAGNGRELHEICCLSESYVV